MWKTIIWLGKNRASRLNILLILGKKNVILLLKDTKKFI